LALIFGVVGQFHFDFSLGLAPVIIVFVLLFVISLPVFSRQVNLTNSFLPILLFTFFGIGGALGGINDSRTNENYFWNDGDEKSDFIGVLTEDPQEKENSYKLVLDVIKKGDVAVMGQTLVYLEKDSSRELPCYGELIAFETKFNPIVSNNNPFEFNYARYLKIHDVHEQAYLKSEDWKKGDFQGNVFMSKILSLRSFFSSVIEDSGMKDKNKMVAKALLLGQKEFLDKEVLRSYSSAGAMHVLAVSGLHVGIVMLIFGFFFKPLKKIRNGKTIYLILILGVIWFYALITGLSPSVMRAAVMFSFIVFGQELQRETSIYQSLMVSAVVLILIEPYIIFQVGFQLSYLAVLGIVFIQPKIYNYWYVKNKVLDKAWQITAVSIAAQLATFPLGLYYFHQFPNFFMISNLIVIPLAFVLLIAGIIYLMTWWIPVISEMVLWIFDFLLAALNRGVEWIEKLPYSIMWGISISWYEVFLIYALLIGFIAAKLTKKMSFLFGSLTLLMVLVGLNINEKVSVSTENKVFIYNVKNELAFDVFYGAKNRFYSSKEFYKNESALLFHVKHNWFHRSGTEDPTEWVNNDEISRLELGDKEFLFISSKSTNSKFETADIIVFHDIKYLDEKNLNIIKEMNSQIIIASNVGYGVRELIIEGVDEEKVFDLKIDGCFELDF
jgi:competence protein ComEC